MMHRIELVDLTLFGAKATAATISFGRRLTLVRGPSDTGKSFVANAIDFMFGAKALREIPELATYDHCLLTFRIAGEPYTAVRRTSGGRFYVYDGIRSTDDLEGGADSLSQVHNPDNEANLSNWLLVKLGIDGARLRKNARNSTVSLSFRDLAHLAIIDETKMQSEVAPIFSGSYVTRTKEVSVLKLLLEGEDDRNLEEIPEASEAKRLKSARLDVVDGMIERARDATANLASRDDLRDQLSKLSQTVKKLSEETRVRDLERQALSESLVRERTRLRASELRVRELKTLQARFGVLRHQYVSDLARLDAIADGASLLGLVSSTECPLCGAPWATERASFVELGTDDAVSAAESEREKTELLVKDLDETLQLVGDRVKKSLDAGDMHRSTAEALSRDLAEFDRSGSSPKRQIGEILTARSTVEAGLSRWSQLSELESVRARIQEENTAETRAQASAIPIAVVNDFSRELNEILKRWEFFEATDASYDRDHHDVFADDQFRADHGKGVRSVLHAAFTLALAEYCLRNELPHPGFVVLDSPVVTYRAPDDPEGDQVDDFATRVYRDVAANFSGQVVILENADPTGGIGAETVDIHFTKNPNVGRYGLFPTSGVRGPRPAVP